jgi:hypothetical protein
LALALLWYAGLALRFPTAGAIGDDPATYVQMALDLTQRGTPLHVFPLFNNLFDQGVSWDALLTPGYHVVRETGVVVPNFAFGFPLLLALAYRVAGENALYTATPLMGALTLLATFGAGNELLCELSLGKRYNISALAVLLLAATPKQIQLALVPMSDVPTQLFCVLALWSALRVARHRVISSVSEKTLVQRRAFWPSAAIREMSAPVLNAGVCGLCLGVAFLIRHSALALLPPLALTATRWGRSARQRTTLIVVALVVCVLTVLPDLSYRAQVLGSVFAVESPESAQTVWLQAPRQFLQMLTALFTVTGFGPLILFAPLGWWMLRRAKQGLAAGVLVLWIAAFVAFHAPLRLTGVFENSLRYLVPAYPAIAISMSVGIVEVVVQAWSAIQGSARFSPPKLAIYLALLMAVVPLAIALRAMGAPERFVARAYGWMSNDARNGFNALDARLPANAVIGVSDQVAGAAMLYGKRDVFRPGSLLEPASQFPRFVQAMTSAGRTVVLLGDWSCSPGADESEKLPAWLQEYKLEDLRLELTGLPYACVQRTYFVR